MMKKWNEYNDALNEIEIKRNNNEIGEEEYGRESDRLFRLRDKEEHKIAEKFREWCTENNADPIVVADIVADIIGGDWI